MGLSFLFLNPAARIAAIGLIIVSAVLGIWTHGDLHGRKAMKLKIEREKQEAIVKGKQGAVDALKKLDDNTIPSYWWRD
jgi:hypothetical protein